MLNRVELIGHLGADPEVRHMQDGRPVVNMRLATSERWKDKNTGEKREHTDWHQVVIFSEGLCRVAEQYLHKGSKVYVSGQLKTRKWQDQSGNDRYSTEVVMQGFKSELVMLDTKGSGFKQADGPGDYGMDPEQAAGPGSRQESDTGQGGQQTGCTGHRSTARQDGGYASDLDDDIPF